MLLLKKVWKLLVVLFHGLVALVALVLAVFVGVYATAADDPEEFMEEHNGRKPS